MITSKEIRFFLIALFILFIVVLDSSCEKKMETGGPPAMPPAKVQVVHIEKRALQSVIDLVGTVRSPKVSILSSEVEGLVKDVVIKEGDFVEKRSVMVILENSQLKIQLKNRKASLKESLERLNELKSGARPQEIEEAKASMLEANAFWSKAKNDFKRNKELYDKKVISEKEYVNSRLASLAAKELYHQKRLSYDLMVEGPRPEQIAQEEARVKMKEARVELIEDKIRKSKIISPYTGVVIERFVEKGEWVEKGKRVLKIGQVDPLRIDILIPEKIISQVKRDDIVTIEFDAFNIDNEEVYGKVSTIIPFSDTSSRTYKVRIRLDNPERRFKVGMVARVSLFYGENEEVLMVPQDALTLSGGNKFITTVAKDQTAHIVPVQIRRKCKGWIEVQGAISEDDLVVIRGNERLRPGQPVQVINSSEGET